MAGSEMIRSRIKRIAVIIRSFLVTVLLITPLSASEDMTMASLLQQLEGIWVYDSSGCIDRIRQNSSLLDTMCGTPWGEEKVQEIAGSLQDDYESNGPSVALRVLPLERDSVRVVIRTNRGKTNLRTLVAFTAVDTNTLECEYAWFRGERIKGQRLRYEFRDTVIFVWQCFRLEDMNCEAVEDAPQEYWIELARFRRPAQAETRLFKLE